MFGGPKVSNTIPKGLQDEQEQVGGFLASLLSSPAALQSFIGQQGKDFIGKAGEGILGLVSGGGDQAATDVIEATRPSFERNLATALGSAGAAASSPFSTAFGLQGADITSRALSDFSLFEAQQRQQAQRTALNAAQVLGSLGQASSGMNLQALDIVSRFFSPQAAAGPNTFQQATGFLDVLF